MSGRMRKAFGICCWCDAPVTDRQKKHPRLMFHEVCFYRMCNQAAHRLMDQPRDRKTGRFLPLGKFA